MVLITTEGQPLPPGWKWIPTVGRETSSLLQRAVPESARQSVQQAALDVLARCTPPRHASVPRVGLVVGYVQSGKTLSFTTVTTLAKDNFFPLVVVIAGTSIPLYEQSSNRLYRDLQIESRNDRSWLFERNPSSQESTRRSMQGVLDDWHDHTVLPSERRTILVTVMKQHQRLGNLSALLRNLNLHGAPALIIDDEADQASLNALVASRRESTTYAEIADLRSTLPNHTYLQYTATPQAPLLVNIIDALSPHFVGVLNPGDEYVGGRHLFGDGLQAPYVQAIPPNQIPQANAPLAEPPDSLLHAMRLFLVGVAVGLLGEGVGHRSMLVHPSRTTDFHSEYCNWVRLTFDLWHQVMRLAEGHPDRIQLIEDFRVAYEDLRGTERNLPSLEVVMRALPRAFRNTQILEVNAARRGGTPRVQWNQSYAWILIGGQAMDRGFTVEGLTVTYMPRALGIGNADTLQQRARFFGYKLQYLGLCRIFLEQQVSQVFSTYVKHEEDMRRQLRDYQDSGRELSEWKRAFVMSPTLRPTRASVLAFDYARGRYSDDWFAPSIVVADERVLAANRDVCSHFLSTVALEPDNGHPARTEPMQHRVCRGVPLFRVLDELLVRLRIVGPKDSLKYTGILLQLRLALEAENGAQELCSIYQMSSGRIRHRSVSDSGEISNLFQGESPVSPRNLRGSVYPGDRNIHHPSQVTIQFHSLDLTDTRGGRVVAQNVPVLAVWIPSRIGENWLVQEVQGAHTPRQ